MNRNVNRNVNRDIDVDVDAGYGRGSYGYHPVARAAAVTTGVAVAAAVGSVVYSIPSSCTTVVDLGVTYHYCDGVYYQPRYSGSSVEYVVVGAP